MTSDLLVEGPENFPILRELTFLNHAGVAPISGRAAQALRQYAAEAETQAYYRSSWYDQVRRIKRITAKLINADGVEEVAFVANTSTGLNMVAGGIDWVAGDNVVITNVEYPANRYPWENLKRLGVGLIEVEQDSHGRIDSEDMANAVTNRTRIVSVSHVQYSSGFFMDLKPISDMVHRAGGYLCVDAIQSIGAVPVDVQAMGIDFLAADGHKWLLAPEGCGIFYCRRDLIELLHPPVVGWMCMVDAGNYGDYRFEFEKDSRRFEPGSYNIPGIMALGASIELLMEVGIDNVWSRIEALTSQLCTGLGRKGYRVFSPREDGQKSGIVTFQPPVGAGELQQIVAELEKKNIVIVVREGRLRASPHYYNTPGQIQALIDALP